jgi:hypothetical protein
LSEQSSRLEILKRGGEQGSRTAVSCDASTLDAQLSRLLYLIEHLLAIIHQHLRPDSAARRSSDRWDGVLPNGSIYAGLLGSEHELDQLRRLMEPIILKLERVMERGGGAGALAGKDISGLELLVRRTKESMYS